LQSITSHSIAVRSTFKDST